MKFQRENLKVALTQKMKDDVAADVAAREEAQRKIIAKSREKQLRILEAERNLAANTAPVMRREMSYGSLVYQLDLLWHDMDNGVIPIDKTAANTWYSHIKEAKEKTPLAL